MTETQIETAYIGVTVSLETAHLFAAAGWLGGGGENGWSLTELGSERLAAILSEAASGYWNG